MAPDSLAFGKFKADGKSAVLLIMLSGWIVAVGAMAYSAWGPPNKINTELATFKVAYATDVTAQKTWQNRCERVLRRLTKGASDDIFLSDAAK